MDKTTQELVKSLQSQGFDVKKTKGSHYKVWKTGQDGLVFMASTPSDTRSVRNTVSRLKKIGYRP